MRRREVEEVGGHGTESEDEVTRAQEVEREGTDSPDERRLGVALCETCQEKRSVMSTSHTHARQWSVVCCAVSAE
jgi:hypothetical protein